ncbi:MAG: hypothetical protein KDB48_00400 [Solirubrobacterales bacterium]|nr:hypothetical protein [Solirubrobacterales bacterium]
MEIFAYLDPGSASALLAAVLAGVAGIGAAIRTFGRNFLDTLMFWRKDEPAVEASPTATPGTAEDKPPEQ